MENLIAEFFTFFFLFSGKQESLEATFLWGKNMGLNIKNTKILTLILPLITWLWTNH